MKNWRTIAAAIAALALATAVGCNADTAKDADGKPEPVIQDGGEQGGEGTETPANDSQPDDESGSGENRGAEPSTDAGGTSDEKSDDQTVGLPTQIEKSAEHLPDDPGDAVSGNEGDGTVSIMPIPEPQLDILPALPEPTEPGVIPPDSPAGDIDPNTPLSNRAASP